MSCTCSSGKKLFLSNCLSCRNTAIACNPQNLWGRLFVGGLASRSCASIPCMQRIVPLFALVFISACDPSTPPDKDMTETDGSPETTCPGGYLCQPNSTYPSCDGEGMQVSPAGLCSYPCANRNSCPTALGGECIYDYMCGTPCQIDKDCHAVGYGTWAICWTAFDGVSVCADPAAVNDPFPSSAADSTGG